MVESTSDHLDRKPNHHRLSRFGIKTLFLLVLVFAVGIVVIQPMLSRDFADLEIVRQEITNAGIQISVATRMPRTNYLDMSCPSGTKALGGRSWTFPGYPKKIEFDYTGRLDAKMSAVGTDGLASGFLLKTGDKIRLDLDNPTVDVYRFDRDGNNYRMTLKLITGS